MRSTTLAWPDGSRDIGNPAPYAGILFQWCPGQTLMWCAPFRSARCLARCALRLALFGRLALFATLVVRFVPLLRLLVSFAPLRRFLGSVALFRRLLCVTLRPSAGCIA